MAKKKEKKKNKCTFNETKECSFKQVHYDKKQRSLLQLFPNCVLRNLKNAAKRRKYDFFFCLRLKVVIKSVAQIACFDFGAAFCFIFDLKYLFSNNEHLPFFSYEYHFSFLSNEAGKYRPILSQLNEVMSIFSVMNNSDCISRFGALWNQKTSRISSDDMSPTR